MYGPYGWPQPPNTPVQFVPVPQGTDTERVLRIVERLQKKERKKEELDKAKKPKDDGPKPLTFSVFQMLLILSVFGLPWGTAVWTVMGAIIKAIKSSGTTF